MSDPSLAAYCFLSNIAIIVAYDNEKGNFLKIGVFTNKRKNRAMSQNIFKAFNDKHLKTGGPDTTANSMRALISPDKEKNICCIFVKIIDSKLRHTENHFYHKCRFSAVSE